MDKMAQENRWISKFFQKRFASLELLTVLLVRRMGVGRIIIFPIKSLDEIPLESARFTAGGILEKDRVFAIYDIEGKVVNGKRTPRVHELRSAFDPEIREVQMWPNGQSPQQFQLDTPALEKWLSDFFDLRSWCGKKRRRVFRMIARLLARRS